MEEVNKTNRDEEEKHDVENVTMEVFDRLLSEVFDTRMHAEKAYEEKDYQLRSTQVHVKELEEAFEKGLDLLDEDDSSMLLKVENLEELYEEDNELKEDVDEGTKEECMKQKLGEEEIASEQVSKVIE